MNFFISDLSYVPYCFLLCTNAAAENNTMHVQTVEYFSRTSFIYNNPPTAHDERKPQCCSPFFITLDTHYIESVAEEALKHT